MGLDAVLDQGLLYARPMVMGGRYPRPDRSAPAPSTGAAWPGSGRSPPDSTSRTAS
jgi:hypothetical protein